MSDREWEQFFNLLNKIIQGGGTWQEKAAEVKRRVDDSDADLDEFLSWFKEDA